MTSYTSAIGTGTDVTVIVSTAMVTIMPTDPSMLNSNASPSSSNNNAAIIGGVVGGIGGALLIGKCLHQPHVLKTENDVPC